MSYLPTGDLLPNIPQTIPTVSKIKLFISVLGLLRRAQGWCDVFLFLFFF